MPRVTDGVGPLIPGQWQVGMSIHSRAYDAGRFVDFDNLVNTDRARTIRAIGNEFRF